MLKKLAVTAALVAALPACEGTLLIDDYLDDYLADGKVTLNLQIGQIGATTISLNAAPSLAAEGVTSPADLEASATPYGFAHIDGLRLDLTQLRLTESQGGTPPLITWEAPLSVELGATHGQTVFFDEPIQAPVGTYEGASVAFHKTFELKGYCRTANGLVYTTAAGARLVEGDSLELPDDYGYATYTMATPGFDSDTEDVYTDYPVTITTSVQNKVAVLFDPSFAISCYDGTDAERNQQPINPYHWDTDGSFFPLDEPGFAWISVAMFTWVSDGADEALPQAETYIASRLVTDVSTATPDYARLNVMTFAFRENGDILDAFGRQNPDDSGLLASFTGFETTGVDEYTLFNGGWICPEGSDEANCGEGTTREVSGFLRLADFETSNETLVEDGPDCIEGAVADVFRCSDPYALFWRRVR